ncbi:MAG: hypothetical protein ACREFO_20350 [Acetobacteraceae bacterium]
MRSLPVIAVGAMLALAMAAPVAHADGWHGQGNRHGGNGGWHGGWNNGWHGRWNNGWRGGPWWHGGGWWGGPVVGFGIIAPPVVYVSPPVIYRPLPLPPPPPPVIYAPPPVVYAPPVVYGPPAGLSIGVTIPLR